VCVDKYLDQKDNPSFPIKRRLGGEIKGIVRLLEEIQFKNFDFTLEETGLSSERIRNGWQYWTDHGPSELIEV
jgi:hypothetical protein